MKKFLAVTLLLCCLFTACSDNDKSESISSEIPSVAEGEAGELITPDEDSDEYSLGEYRYSSDGTKLYYNESEYSTELMLTLEKYFKSFEENNYENYKSCLYPSYIDEMNGYLKENYDYDLETSFKNQRESLSEKMGGDFKVTRIKVEKTESDSVESYFEPLDETFGKDYYDEIKDGVDNLYYIKFYVMAENSEDTESLLVGGFEIVFAEKDGKYYTFG